MTPASALMPDFEAHLRAFDLPASDGPHVPVMIREVVEALAPGNCEVIVDGTFGAGGYTQAILNSAGCRVIGIDRDPNALRAGRAMQARMEGRLALVAGRFGDVATLLETIGEETVDGLVLDIGVSSMQIDEAERGFSFRFDGPLDMRMSNVGPTAADIVNTLPEKDLAALLHVFGEERRARAIATAIGAARAEAPITSTARLAALVERTIGRAPGAIHPATRTFQALRIAVNDELGELARALLAAESVLKPGGRLVVVTFHSLEDRIVKTFFTDRAREVPAASRHAPPAARGPAPTFAQKTRGVIKPADDEVAVNPRARSAKLRAGVRTSEAARGGDPLGFGVPHVPALLRFMEGL